MATRKTKKQAVARDGAGPASTARMRGVETFDTEERVLLIRADVEQAAGALVERAKAKTWRKDVLGQSVTVTEPSFLVMRLRGHAWSLIAPLTGGPRSDLRVADAAALAKALKAPAIYFVNSDCASATAYEYFDAAGKSAERFECVDGPAFTSRLRQVEPPEDGPAIYEFVREFMRQQDAFVPPISILFFAGGKKVELTPEDELPAEEIERLDFVAVAGTGDGDDVAAKGKAKDDAKPAKRMSKEDRRDAEYTMICSIRSLALEAVRQMLAEGVDPNARDIGGRFADSAIFVAVFETNNSSLESRVKLAKVLGKQKLDVKQLRRDALEVVRLLLDAGADPNVGNGSRTPLSLAAEWGDVELARLLLEAGADPTIPDRHGGTPLDIAKQSKQPAMVKLMRAAGGKKA